MVTCLSFVFYSIGLQIFSACASTYPPTFVFDTGKGKFVTVPTVAISCRARGKTIHMKISDMPDCIGKSCDKSVAETKEGKEELARTLELMLQCKYVNNKFLFIPRRLQISLFPFLFYSFAKRKTKVYQLIAKVLHLIFFSISLSSWVEDSWYCSQIFLASHEILDVRHGEEALFSFFQEYYCDMVIRQSNLRVK